MPPLVMPSPLVEPPAPPAREAEPPPSVSYLYSATTRGFYVAGINPVIPADAKPVTAEDHALLLAAQGEGAAIQPDADGLPRAVMPPPIPPLVLAKAAAVRAVKAAYAAKLDAGLPWRGKVLQIDDASCARINAGSALADKGAVPPGFAWRMADNTPLAMTPAQMTEMAVAAGGAVYALRAVMWAKLDALGAADTLAKVAAVDPAAGWPA